MISALSACFLFIQGCCWPCPPCRSPSNLFSQGHCHIQEGSTLMTYSSPPKVLTPNTLSLGFRTSVSEFGVDICIQTVATTKVKSDDWFGNMENWSETRVEPVQGQMKEVEKNILNVLQKFSLEGDLKREWFLVLSV